MPANEFTGVSEAAWQDANRLTASADNSLPVDLELYAKEFGIRHIKAMPLLSDAGLARGSSDLEIIINTEAPSVHLPAGFSASVGDGTWERFQPSLRFTVAHELSHAIFLRAAGWDRGLNVLEAEEDDLEKGCNRLARLLLMPKRRLIQEIGEHLLDIRRVATVCGAFRVSPQVFLRRFHLSDMRGAIGKLDGFLAFVREQEQKLVIVACHIVGSYAKRRFHDALPRKKVRQEWKYSSLSANYRETRWRLEDMILNDANLGLKRDIESTLRSQEAGAVEMEVAWGDGEAIPCELAFVRIHDRPLSCWVRVQVLGPMQKPGHRELF